MDRTLGILLTGDFTMEAAALGCRVVSFEMQPELHAMVALSVRASGYSSRVTLHNTALWDSETELRYASTRVRALGVYMCAHMRTRTHTHARTHSYCIQTRTYLHHT